MLVFAWHLLLHIRLESTEDIRPQHGMKLGDDLFSLFIHSLPAVFQDLLNRTSEPLGEIPQIREPFDTRLFADIRWHEEEQQRP